MATEFNVPESQRSCVDLRSDTVTRPTAEMMEAMQNAPLGDDVLGDDPTVAELEALAAGMAGKEAAVFVPSGTMGNQIALLCHCDRGDVAILEEEAHMLYYECGAPGVLGGVVTMTLPSVLGVMDPDDVERHVMKRSLHTPGTSLLCVENTHNRAGGTIVPLDAMAAYRAIADRHGFAVHLDGARVFNASVALDVPAQRICGFADSVSFCLSKGLGSPVGSVLCGSASFIVKARQWRKRLGGGMRQAGLLAACGLVSLRTMVSRLAQDHARARTLAAALADLPGVAVESERVQTNMVLATVDDAAAWIARLKEKGVLALSPSPRRLRLVLHADIDDAKLERAIEGFRLVATDMAGASAHLET